MKRSKITYSRSSTIVALPVIGACLLGCVLSAFFGQLWMAASLMFVCLFASAARLWAWLSMRKIDIEVSSAARGVFPDDEIEFLVQVENGKFLPLVWLELFAPVPESRCLLPQESRVPDDWEYAALNELGADTNIVGEKKFGFMLWYETARVTTHWKAVKRGMYSMANWRLRTGDGFGLVQMEQPLHEEDVRKIAVYPRLVPVIPDMFLRNLWNSESGSKGVMEDPTVIRSTRDYQTFDSLKQINWRLAARGLPLTVNVYEDILPKSAHFIFDGNSFGGEAPHAEELEEALSILASLCVRLESMDVRCGISFPRWEDHRAVNLFAADGAVTEELLRAMAAYKLPKPEYDKDSDSNIMPLPQFDRAAIFDGAKHAGRFYYVAYDSRCLQDRSLLRALEEAGTTILTYCEPEAFGEYEMACLRHLKEVRADG